MGVLVLDVVVFLLLSATGLVGGSGPTEPSSAHAMAILGSDGRFALVDQGGAHQRQYEALGVPNMNVFTKLPSVQGYGSLISTIYDDATGTHPQSAVDPCRLADGTFAQLRLSAIAVTYADLGHNVIVAPTKAPNCKSPPPSFIANRYFGQILHATSVQVHGRGDRPISKGEVYFTLLDWNGRGVGPVLHEVGTNDMTFTVTRTVNAAGFELFSKKLVSIGDAFVTQRTPVAVTYQLNSPMQEALDNPRWHLSDTVGTYSVFTAQTVKPTVWLTQPENGALSHVKNVAYGDTWVDVHATVPVTLVRSMAYLPGWRATALNTATGKTRALPVWRNGLIQEVAVPKGDWQIHFHYHAPYIEVGLAASIVGSVLIVASGVYLVLEDRRRREDKVRS